MAANGPVEVKVKPSISLDLSKEQIKDLALGDLVEVRIQGKVDNLSAGDAFPEDKSSLRLIDRKILSLKKANSEKSLEEMENDLPKADR